MLAVGQTSHTMSNRAEGLSDTARIALVVSLSAIALSLVVLSVTVFQTNTVQAMPDKSFSSISGAQIACWVTASLFLTGAFVLAIPLLKPGRKYMAGGEVTLGAVPAPLGGYWRPGSKKIGDMVVKGDVLGEIEVMKMYISIRAPQSGTIVEIYSPNQGIVDAKTPLFRIE